MRRWFLGTSVRIASRSFAKGGGTGAAVAGRRPLTVAAAQLRPTRGVRETTDCVVDFVSRAGTAGVDLVVFPECAIPGYAAEPLSRLCPNALREAVSRVASACKAEGVAVALGVPHLDTSSGEWYGSGKWFNSAVLINADGNVVGRQHKMQLVPPEESWAQPGREIGVFELCGAKVGVIICHDKRFPELARLPVLAGARMILYMSCEGWHDDLPLTATRQPAWQEGRFEKELAVYRAQTQARAVENRVWLIKANTSGCPEQRDLGSHGCSSIIDPTGIIRVEAGVFSEEMVTCEIDLGMADALYAEKALKEEFALRRWWLDGLAHVVVHPAVGNVEGSINKR